MTFILAFTGDKARIPTHLAFLIFAICLVSCSSTKKISSFNIPESFPPVPASDFDIPIRLNAKPILFKANFLVPNQFFSDGWPNYVQPSCDFRYKYRFVRSAFTLTCTSNQLGIQMIGTYQVAGAKCICSLNKPVSPWISGSCGFGQEPMRRVSINITSRLNLLPNFRLQAATGPVKVVAQDRCYVSLFSSDVTQQVLDSIRAAVTSFCSTVDATVAGMDLSGLLQRSVDKGFTKVPIGKYGYVLVNPTSVRVGQLNYAKDSFSISVGLSCTPQLSSDSTNQAGADRRVPVSLVENRDNVSTFIDAVYDYDFISKLLSDTLRNRVFDYKGRTIVIKDAAVKGTGHHQIEVMIDFAGTNKGRLYLRGTPVLDTTKQTITLPDISYSLESGDLALKIGKSLFSNKIKKTIRGRSYLDVNALVHTNIGYLDSLLSRDLGHGATLSGKIRDLKVTGLIPEERLVRMRIYAKANLEIESNGNF
ncbi:MAG TPA: DUF4403 family protein [Puia sp.]|nr:DUF4403 family protein [Puia sp.]